MSTRLREKYAPFFREALRCLLFALLLNFALESLSLHSPLPVLFGLLTRPWAFCYNALLVFCLLSLSLLCRRRTFALTLTATLLTALAIVNCVMRIVRITPLCFYDFVIFVENFSITNAYVTVWQIVLITVAILALLAGLTLLFLRCKKRVPQRRAAAAFLAALYLLAGLATVPYALFCRDFTDPSKAYARYGFLYSLLRSAVDRGVDRAADYSEDTIDDIRQKVEEDAAPAFAQEQPNFIFLQLESFLDPANVTTIECSENPVPTFTRLKAECTGGDLRVPMIGGGTANVEFEVLTGMNLNDFGTGEYPYSTVLQDAVCESIAHDLKALGYTAHAVHSHTATFYQRHLVFPRLGFDTFTSIEYMQDYETNALGWCRDKALTGCILDALNYSAGPDVVFAVSVQGHGKYASEAPETPYPIQVTGLEDDPAVENEFEYYVSQLAETDAFLAELLDALRAYPEPVALVVYGDHLPAINIPEEALRTHSLMTTEYVLWSNDGFLTPERKDLTSYQLTAYAVGRYGISNGVLMRFHQQCAGDADYLEDLHHLEYDVLYGDHYLYDGGLPYAPSEMRMGVRDITLRDALCSDQGVVVHGENFTQSSVVYVNGHALDTIYVDGGTLAALPGLLESAGEGDEVCVKQVATDGTVLSQTAAVLCTAR